MPSPTTMGISPCACMDSTKEELSSSMFRFILICSNQDSARRMVDGCEVKRGHDENAL